MKTRRTSARRVFSFNPDFSVPFFIRKHRFPLANDISSLAINVFLLAINVSSPAMTVFLLAINVFSPAMIVSTPAINVSSADNPYGVAQAGNLFQGIELQHDF